MSRMDPMTPLLFWQIKRILVIICERERESEEVASPLKIDSLSFTIKNSKTDNIVCVGVCGCVCVCVIEVQHIETYFLALFNRKRNEKNPSATVCQNHPVAFRGSILLARCHA